MKKSVVILLALAAVASSALLWSHFRGDSHEDERLTEDLRGQIEEKNREVASLEAERERAEQQLRDFARASDELMAQASAREAALSNAAAATAPSANSPGEQTVNKGGLGKLLNNLMSDPEMKKMMVSQQQLMVGQLYGPLISKLQLSPEESHAFKDLLVNNMLKATEMATSMFGKATPEERTELSKTLAAGSQAMEQSVKDLLGDQRYAQYQEYQQTVGERAQLGLFRQESMGSGEPVSEAQFAQLLDVMRDEKVRMSSTAGIDFPDGLKGQFPDAMDDAQVEKLLSLQEQVNQNVQVRAGDILSPSQMDAFGRHQENQLQMIRMGLNMARKLMTPEKE